MSSPRCVAKASRKLSLRPCAQSWRVNLAHEDPFDMPT